MGKSVIIYSYYSPEEITGIGKYNGELMEWLLGKNVKVTSISNAPFYPHWKIYEGHSNKLFSKRVGKFRDIRSYVYIPKSPETLNKIISECIFAITSAISLIHEYKRIKKANLFIVINPPFFLGFVPLLFSKIFRVPILFHVQDLQINAARELKLLPKFLCRILLWVERLLLNRADFVSTISVGMKKKMYRKNLSKEVILLPNWADLSLIYPTEPAFFLHDYLKLDHDLKLVVYSGNIGKKQGLEILLNAAKELSYVKELHFVILGEGLYKSTLQSIIDKMLLKNISIGSLVKKEEINDMLNSSFIQLVIQKGQGADSFLPSKLTNILAAGCAAIVTANRNTTLHDILVESQAAIVIDADSTEELIKAIEKVLKNLSLIKLIKTNARSWAIKNLPIDNCLNPLMEIINTNSKK